MVSLLEAKQRHNLINVCEEKEIRFLKFNSVHFGEVVSSRCFICVAQTNVLSRLTFRCPYTLDPDLDAHYNWRIDLTHSLSEACVSLFSMSGETLI